MKNVKVRTLVHFFGHFRGHLATSYLMGGTFGNTTPTVLFDGGGPYAPHGHTQMRLDVVAK